MINGLNHITLSVRSLTESFVFYKDIIGFKPLMKKTKNAYFLAGDVWFCIEEDPFVRTRELPEYTHIAFSISQEEFQRFYQKLVNAKVQFFKKNKSQGDSVYFLDPNGHKLEVHVGDWKSRLKEYYGQPDTEFFD